MKERIGKLTPKDCYIPIRSSSLEDEGVVLSHLYQPIVGRDAVTLFLFLEGEARLSSKEKTHHTIMSYLKLPLDKVYEARVQLEAIGLLKAFKKVEKDRNVFMYRLVPPFSAYQFFNDHMLSLLLMHEVGEEKFLKLKESFDFTSVDASEYEEVTASFEDVFRPVASMPQQMSDEGETITQQGVASGESHLDFEWLMQSLREHMLPASKILGKENSKLIEQLAVLYQITTADMEKAILWSLSDENELDPEELKASCHDLAQATPVSNSKPAVEEKKEKVETNKEPASKNEKFIQMLEDITPRELLEDVANGQKAADQDVKLIRDVMTEQGLPKGVMNVLVHYVLLKTDMKLSKPYLEKIASHWARKNVKTVEQAMNMARAEHKKYQQWGQEKRKARSNEVLPDWYKKQKHQESSVSKKPENKEKTEKSASEDEIAERIQRITQKRKGR
ncbi:replication initiation and membrane attachment family protein [Salimicrobium halophilum]|uniref:Replicative DNA helicase loader DnaB n=1 Tax=Salimicrobium halophilum TaxID=86666 RepID=A0A1G8VJC2_9BACI|nr:DnaD domain protein [Salimicrobium halophilum]SDJ65270.1 replicative DNA helicase loader DnaB [Salimicrobium halophilum]